MRRPSGDEALVRRASRALGLQAAALVAVSMLLLVAVVSLVFVKEQEHSSDSLLRSTVATVDDVGDPPTSSWIVISRVLELSVSPGLPQVLTTKLEHLREASTTRPKLTTITLAGSSSFRVVTQMIAGEVVQVVLDLRDQEAERHRLLDVMGGAAVCSLLVAGALGSLVGRRAVRPLAKALVLQRAFVADASHELRTPLTLLSTRVQVLDRALRATPASSQLLQDSQGVVTDVQRMGEVVEDLLIAADPRRDDQHEPQDLGTVAAGVADSARAHAGLNDVRVALYVAQSEDRYLVSGSGTALRRAILALVDNAVDHSPPGGEVRIEVSRNRKEVIVAVSDTGPGINAESRKSLFQRFHSGGQSAGRAHYGLGLALTHDVADRHGGSLRIAPSTTGTRFELSIPVRH